MKPPLVSAVLATLAAAATIGAAGSEPADPFGFFAPTVRLSAADKTRLANGDVIARVLPADDGHVAFFAAAQLDAQPDSLLVWTRAIEALKQGPLVLDVGRFPEPVGDDALDALTLEEDEIDALTRCRPNGCDFKLAAAEILELQDAIRRAGTGWRDAAQRQFRRALIARVRLHRDRGLLALPPYADHGGRMSVGEAFSAMTSRSPYLTRTVPEVVNALLTPRRAPVQDEESFYYWSRERYGAGKTVVTITYVQLVGAEMAGPRALTVSTSLYASHYIDGALGVTAVVCDETSRPCYLAYLNRTRVDLLGGLFGGFKRAVLEDRIRSDGPALMRRVIRRLESGRPGTEGGES
jgi:hypothetical protein